MPNLRCAGKTNTKGEIVQSCDTDALVVNTLEYVRDSDQDHWRDESIGRGKRIQKVYCAYDKSVLYQ